MASVLVISSQVARGYVGATAARLALERLGHEAWVLPSVVLSNHPGHARSAGLELPPDALRRMLEALEASGWLAQAQALLTGYLPSEGHVELAFEAAARLRAVRPQAVILCDPAFGDLPKGLYVPEAAADAIRDLLVPVAGIVTPNAFELAWLTGASVTGADEARAAARALAPAAVAATSVPDKSPDRLLNLLVECDAAWTAAVARRPQVPHGTGDLFAALLLGHLLNGRTAAEALALAVAGVDEAIAVSADADELRLAATAAWAEPALVRPAQRLC